MTGETDDALLREKMRAAVAGLARRGSVLKRASGPYLLGLICAATLVPVVAAGFTGLPVVLALSAAVGSVGANVLTEVTSKVIEGLRKEGPDLPPPEVIERELAAALNQALSEDGERARALRAEIAALFQRVDAVGAVVEASDAQLREAMVAGFGSLATRFEEFAFVVADARRALWLMESSLRRQEAQHRVGLERVADQDVTLRLVLDKIAAVEARSRVPDGSQSSAAMVWEGCPYRGLAPFEERHSAVFYGRAEATTRLVQQLAARLTHGQILVVLGASGAGKSSLLRAGLVPRLASDLLVPGSAGWPRRVLTPTGRPLEELAAHLANLSGVDATAAHRSLAADPAGARLLARQVLHAAGGGVSSPEGQVPRRLVLIVDQFEELFTLVDDSQGEEERLAFIAALSAAATAGRTGGEPAALVVIAVRGDFLDRAAAYPELREALRSGPFVLGPMTEAELRLAITGPAAETDVALEPGLVDAVLGELRDRTLVTGYDAGVLPLLSQAMLAVWEQRAGGPLTVRAYWRTGGVGQAVQTSAEGVYERLSPAAREFARSVFTQLTVVTSSGQLACRRASREELAIAASATPGDLDAVVSAFATQRLLVLEHHTVEIAHDALLRGWSRLRGWLDAEQADRTLYRELAEAASTWDAHGRDASFLYRGAQLGSATQAATRWCADPVRFPALSPLTRGFLASSQRADLRIRWRRRGLTAALSLLTMAALVAAGLAIRNEADLRQQHALALSRQLDAQSEAASQQDRLTAGRLAAAAWRMAPTDEAFVGMRALLTQPRSVLYGHTAGVNDVAFSPDGRLLASASDDRTIRLWDPVTGLPVGRPLTGHTGRVVRLAFSTDGLLASASDEDGTVRLWNPATGGQIGRPLTGHNGWIYDVAFSPDGRLLASAENGTVRLWNPATGGQLGRILTGYTGPVTAVAFSPDGRLLASAARDLAGDGVIQLWNTVTRRPVRRPLTGHKDWIRSVAFSHDGRLLASASLDKTVRLWNPTTGHEIGPVLSDHADGVDSVVFSRDDRLLASASGGAGGTVLLWDTATGKLVRKLTGHAGPVNAVSFSPDGRLLASGGDDGTVRLWDPATGRPVSQSMNGTRGFLFGVAFSPDGRLLATANGNNSTLSLWDPATGRPVGKPLADRTSSEVGAVAFSRDGRLLASGDADGTVLLWDPATGRLVGKLTGHAGGVTSVAFSSDGRLLASGDDGGIRLWDPATGRLVGKLTGHVGRVNAVRFSPDGRLLASGGADGTLRLWDPATRRQVDLLVTSTSAVNEVVFSPDGRFLASGGADGTLRLWDPATGRPVGRPVADPSGVTDRFGVTGVAFSPDGKLLAHASLLTLSLTDRDILADTPGVICSLFGSLTREEWNKYLHGEPFSSACP